MAKPRRRAAARRPPDPGAALDLVAVAEKQRLAWLLGRMKARQSLSAGQRRELALLQARLGAPAPVACAVGVADGRPYLVLPPGYSAAVSTEEQVAEPYAVDARTVRLWRAKPGWPAAARGPYLLVGALPEFLRGLRERERAAPAADGNEELKRDILELRRVELEQKVASRKADAVPRERLRAALAAFGRGLDNILKDVDDTYAGSRARVQERLGPLFAELISTAPEG